MYSFPSTYERTRLDHSDLSFEVYRRGAGPGVIVMAEMPGPTPKVIAFADRLVDAGFHVAIPLLFGQPNRPPSPLYFAQTGANMCVRFEFGSMLKESKAPVTAWLHALARDVYAKQGGRGVGVVGMCFTGKLALTTCLEPCVRAGVASQPSHPATLSTGHARSTGMMPEELAQLRARALDGEVRVLGLRFTGDLLSPGGRFATLRSCLGDKFEGIEIDSRRGNAFGIPARAHSVLTEDLVDAPGHPTQLALTRTLDFLRECLMPPAAP